MYFFCKASIQNSSLSSIFDWHYGELEDRIQSWHTGKKFPFFCVCPFQIGPKSARLAIFLLFFCGALASEWAGYGEIIDYLSNRFGGRKFRSLTHSTICFQNPMGGAESLLPSSTVTLLTSKWRKADANGETGANGSNGNTNGTNGVNGANGVKSLNHQTPKRKFPMEKAKRIDVISRFFFPIVFALFNIVYWSTYLLQVLIRCWQSN